MILEKRDLDSSNLQHIKLDTTTQIMTVKFQGRTLKSGKFVEGGVYEYSNVTKEIFDTIANAKENPDYEYSNGKCFISIIKKHPIEYPAVRIS